MKRILVVILLVVLGAISVEAQRGQRGRGDYRGIQVQNHRGGGFGRGAPVTYINNYDYGYRDGYGFRESRWVAPVASAVAAAAAGYLIGRSTARQTVVYVEPAATVYVQPPAYQVVVQAPPRCFRTDQVTGPGGELAYDSQGRPLMKQVEIACP